MTDLDHQRLLERPIESDTQVFSTRYQCKDGIPFLIEKWSWEAITGSSAIFLSEHVGKMDVATLERFVTKWIGTDLGGVTISRRKMHSFVNFGFVAH